MDLVKLGDNVFFGGIGCVAIDAACIVVLMLLGAMVAGALTSFESPARTEPTPGQKRGRSAAEREALVGGRLARVRHRIQGNRTPGRRR